MDGFEAALAEQKLAGKWSTYRWDITDFGRGISTKRDFNPANDARHALASIKPYAGKCCGSNKDQQIRHFHTHKMKISQSGRWAFLCMQLAGDC